MRDRANHGEQLGFLLPSLHGQNLLFHDDLEHIGSEGPEVHV